MNQREDKHTVFISAGSNIGDRAENLQQALGMLVKLPQTSVVNVSRIYHSEPLGLTEQEWFYNTVFELHTAFSPCTLLSHCKQIETRMGRPAEHAKWGPRIIDLDILLFDKITCRLETLTIPHPELPNRKFVLLPMLDLANPLHPVLGKTIEELLETCPDRSVIERCNNVFLKIP